MTISFMPRSAASFRRCAGLFIGAPLDLAITGLAPTSSQVSALSKACAPACQCPCRAIAILAAGLSMAMAEKMRSEPSAVSHERAIADPAGLVTLPVP